MATLTYAAGAAAALDKLGLVKRAAVEDFFPLMDAYPSLPSPDLFTHIGDYPSLPSLHAPIVNPVKGSPNLGRLGSFARRHPLLTTGLAIGGAVGTSLGINKLREPRKPQHVYLPMPADY